LSLSPSLPLSLTLLHTAITMITGQ
jgi:hypothetical protein